MTKISTMGTNCCATMALSGFSKEEMWINEDAKAGKSPSCQVGAYTAIKNWTRAYLLAHEDRPGQSGGFPFEHIMQVVHNHDTLKTKFCIVTLNAVQYSMNHHYWPKELSRWGFKEAYKMSNKNGMNCTCFVRNPLELEITPHRYEGKEECPEPKAPAVETPNSSTFL